MNEPDFQHVNQKRILVTGGAGFIGSHLCEQLLLRGASVTALDNFDDFYPRDEKENNIAGFASHSHLTLVEGDIRDAELMHRLIAETKPDAIVHLAARAGVRPSIEKPELYADVNVRGTVVVLEAARAAGIRNFVFASSSSVYGNSKIMPLQEYHPTDHPISPYGATKKAGELLCNSFCHLANMSICCLRFFTVYGSRQRPDLAIRKFVHLALHDEEIPVYGDGSSSRDYTHIRDILTGVLGAIKWGQNGKAKYGVYNLGSSHPIIMHNLLRGIEKCLGKKLKRHYLPFQPGDVLQTFADTTRARSDLGFHQQVHFDDGLKEFVEWMKIRELEHSV